MSIPCSLCRLANGSEVVLGVPEPDRDVEALMRFFRRLPVGEKALVPYDVDDPDVVRTRLLEVYHQDHWRLVGLVDGEILGLGMMDRESAGWLRHVAVLRVLLDHQRGEIGIRRLLSDRLVAFARSAGVERLCTEVIAGHGEVIAFYERQGFLREAVRKGLARDAQDKLHDVVILSNDLERVWRQLEENLNDLDVAVTRLSGVY